MQQTVNLMSLDRTSMQLGHMLTCKRSPEERGLTCPLQGRQTTTG